jgi:hypothetical protein
MMAADPSSTAVTLSHVNALASRSGLLDERMLDRGRHHAAAPAEVMNCHRFASGLLLDPAQRLEGGEEDIRA